MLVVGHQLINGLIELANFIVELLKALLTLMADKEWQLNFKRILFGPVEFASLFGHATFTLVDQELELLFNSTHRSSTHWPSLQAKTSDDSSIDQIILGPTQDRHSEKLHLCWIEHADCQTSLMQCAEKFVAIDPR